MSDASRPEWFKDLPEEEGLFWFYGKKFPDDKDCQWSLVKKHKIQNGFLSVMDGAFLFDYRPEGVFCRVQLPDLPEIPLTTADKKSDSYEP